MSTKIQKRGRPLGSGNKVKTILGIRVSCEEYDIIEKGLAKLKPKFKTNKKIITYLFEKYNKFHIGDKAELDELLLKLISKKLNKDIYSKEEKKQLKEFYKKIQSKGLKNIFNIWNIETRREYADKINKRRIEKIKWE